MRNGEPAIYANRTRIVASADAGDADVEHGAGAFAARAIGGRIGGLFWRPHGDSNPGYRRERAMS